MKRSFCWSPVLVVLVLAFAVAPVQAHHSFLAEFDGNKTVTIEGVITKVDWVNPHGWWRVDATALAAGEAAVELPGVLR